MLLYLEIDVSFTSASASPCEQSLFYILKFVIDGFPSLLCNRKNNVQECSLFDEVYRVLTDHDVIYGGSRS